MPTSDKLYRSELLVVLWLRHNQPLNVEFDPQVLNWLSSIWSRCRRDKIGQRRIIRSTVRYARGYEKTKTKCFCFWFEDGEEWDASLLKICSRSTWVAATHLLDDIKSGKALPPYLLMDRFVNGTQMWYCSTKDTSDPYEAEEELEVG